MLELEGITVNIGEFRILRGLGLTVPKGRIVGLVGRNGAGKTTTLRAIMGLLPLSTGRVALDGRDIGRLAAHERARLGFGYLPEDRRLIESLTVDENLLVPAQATGQPQAERLAEVYTLLPELREAADRRAGLLSGGQQKLAALGRSLINGHRLLLLDEPFEGVSPALSHRLARAIRDYQHERPELAVLVAESDLKRVAMLTDVVHVIERGEVVERTTIDRVEL